MCIFCYVLTYVYKHIHEHISKYIFININLFLSIYSNVYTYMLLYTYVQECMHIHTCVCIYIDIYIYTHIYIYIYVCMLSYIYIYIYIHVNSCIYIQMFIMTYLYMYVYLHLYIQIYIRNHINKYIYINIHMYMNLPMELGLACPVTQRKDQGEQHDLGQQQRYVCKSHAQSVHQECVHGVLRPRHKHANNIDEPRDPAHEVHVFGPTGAGASWGEGSRNCAPGGTRDGSERKGIRHGNQNGRGRRLVELTNGC